MYAYFIGNIAEIGVDYVVLDVNHVGYNIYISSFTQSNLPPIGQEVKLYTYTCVREDAFLLYGFLSKDDLEIFKLLLTINGIGPKAGLGILSSLRPDDLRFAIMAGDVKAISKAPGIGKKIAERIILELKNKISLEDSLQILQTDSVGNTTDVAVNSTIRAEAIEALTALGYPSSEALKAVNGVPLTEDMDVETLLKLALKAMLR